MLAIGIHRPREMKIFLKQRGWAIDTPYSEE